VLAGKDVAEERSHLSGTYYQYLHFIKFMRPIYTVNVYGR